MSVVLSFCTIKRIAVLVDDARNADTFCQCAARLAIGETERGGVTNFDERGESWVHMVAFACWGGNEEDGSFAANERCLIGL